MIKILFIRTQKAFLPDIDAYIEYFSKDKRFQVFENSEIESLSLDDFDVVWEFKGFGGVKKGNFILVHEYLSLSTGRLAKQKDFLKRIFNPKPDMRIFLNSEVKKKFGFKDSIDFFYRDMGVGSQFFKEYDNHKKYDFIYVGPITTERQIDKLIKAFLRDLPEKTLCLVGNYENAIYDKFRNYKNIKFIGKIPYQDVPKIASQATFGLNFIPDEYPFNIQTSTKLLEYLALGLKVITTEYEWINQFEKNNNCHLYKINAVNPVLNWNNIEKFTFKNVDNMESFYWEKIIDNSLLKEKILSLFHKEQ